MKKTMKKSDMLHFNKILNELIDAPGANFAYAATINKETMRKEIKAIEKAGEPSKDFVKYENERQDLCKKMCRKDGEGKPVIKSNEYLIEDRPAFDKKLDKLKKTHKIVIDQRDKQIADVNKMLEEDITIGLKQIKLVDVPKNITGRQMGVLVKMVKE